jgi:hypothetical protein
LARGRPLKTLIDKIVVEENPADGHVLSKEDLAGTLNEETPGNAGRAFNESSLGLEGKDLNLHDLQVMSLTGVCLRNIAVGILVYISTH